MLVAAWPPILDEERQQGLSAIAHVDPQAEWELGIATVLEQPHALMGVVKLFATGKPGAGERRESSRIGTVSLPQSGSSDVLPGDVCMGADLSVGGGGQSVSARTEVVGDRAEWAQEALGVLG